MRNNSCGTNHSLILANNKVYAVGRNCSGQLGLGNKIVQTEFQLVEFFIGKNVQQLVCGKNHSLAIADDNVYAWGDNSDGQLGLGNVISQSTPQLVQFFVGKNIQQLICFSSHSFAVVDNQIYAWGDNRWGQLGLGNKKYPNSTPQLVEFFAGKNVQQIACGDCHLLVVADRQVYAVGLDTRRQLGLKNGGDHLIPQLVEFFADKNVQRVACGADHSFAFADDLVYAWGFNDCGQLGLGNKKWNPPPQSVEFFTGKNIQQFVCTSESTLAIIDGRLYAWGSNDYGQLGSEQTTKQSTPQLVEFFIGKNIQQLICGSYHLFVIADNLVYAWGYHQANQLGIGNNEPDRYGLGKKISVSTPQLVNFFIDKLGPVKSYAVIRNKKIVKYVRSAEELINNMTRSKTDFTYIEYKTPEEIQNSHTYKPGKYVLRVESDKFIVVKKHGMEHVADLELIKIDMNGADELNI